MKKVLFLFQLVPLGFACCCSLAFAQKNLEPLIIGKRKFDSTLTREANKGVITGPMPGSFVVTFKADHSVILKLKDAQGHKKKQPFAYTEWEVSDTVLTEAVMKPGEEALKGERAQQFWKNMQPWIESPGADIRGFDIIEYRTKEDLAKGPEGGHRDNMFLLYVDEKKLVLVDVGLISVHTRMR